MGTLLKTLADFALSPERTMRHAAHPPPDQSGSAAFVMAVVLLAALSLLFSIGMLGSDRLRYQRKRSRVMGKGDSVGMMIVCALLLPGLWFWLALVTRGLLLLLRSSAPFETLFCLLAYAGAPQFLGWAAYPLRNLHWRAYRAWQAFMASVLLWTTVLVGAGLYAVCGLTGWRLALAGFPLPLLLWSAGVSAAKELPGTFNAARRWRQAAGERVVVFMPPGVNSADALEITQGCDATLAQAARLLEAEPPAFKVGVFLFANTADHKSAMEMKRKIATGYSHGDCITLVYGRWPAIRGIVAHEFGHVLREQSITSDPPGILDEGLSEYVGEELVPHSAHRPMIALPHSLRVLAHNAVFYDWLYAEQTEYGPAQYYGHAHALARFLITHQGIRKYKQFLREAGKDTSEDAGERMANAARKIYGQSLPQMEAEWRNQGETSG